MDGSHEPAVSGGNSASLTAEGHRKQRCGSKRGQEPETNKSEEAQTERKMTSSSSGAATRKKRRFRPSAKQIHDKNQRDTDNSRILNLTLDVNDLRKQVHDCLVQKSLWETRHLVARQQFHARSLQSIDHFFKLFRHGYPEELPVKEQQFLAALLDESIAVGGDAKGRVHFFEQWRRYKKLFCVRRINTNSTRVITSDSTGCLIECSGTFEGCVTIAALQSVFPGALQDKSVVGQVLQRSFLCPTRTLISLDSSGRLVQYDAYSDIFEAMSNLLDFNPFRVAKLMGNALISDGSLLPPAACIDARYQVHTNASLTNPLSSRHSIDFILS